MPSMPGHFPENAIPTEDVFHPLRVTPGLSSIVASKQEDTKYDRYHPRRDDMTMGDYSDLPPHLRPKPPQEVSYYYPEEPRPKPPQEVPYYYPEDPRERNGHKPSNSTASTGDPRYRHASMQQQHPIVSPDTGRGQNPVYAPSQAYQYAVPPGNVSYTSTPHTAQPQYPPAFTPYAQNAPSLQQSRYHNEPHSVPPPPPVYGYSTSPPLSKPPPPVYGYSAPPPLSKPPPSPGLVPRMDRLSVGSSKPDMHGGKPPASPLLEAYKGTYQSMSPMPSPMMLAKVHHGSDIDDLPPLTPISSSDIDAIAVRAGSKRVQIYDASKDARELAVALSHKTPDPDPLIDILPALTNDQMMELREEYKKHCKVAGHGVNLAKHIKLKLPSSSLGKIAHITALGRWGSEAYWANFWYNSNSSRRELLIESLMGRSNAEIREIKAAFKDKRYGDSLEKCMDKELKADKFRMAVMMALEEKRQEEQHVYPLEYRNQDVDVVYRALNSKEGGETAILQLVVMRSDANLREVVKTYERKYTSNFPREALKKSNNLVGEILAHILNGAINRPARDALLMHHAITDLASKTIDQRHELLISRLVRLHWERAHLRRVKEAYEERYGIKMEKDIDRVARGDFGDFCLALCQ